MGGAGASNSLKLAGDLAGFNLADVVQLIIVTKKTGELSIVFEGTESLLYFENGRVVHAEQGGVQGEDVAFSVFFPRVGHFEFISDLFPEVKSLDIDGTFFLMEAMRRLDEVDSELPTESSPNAGATTGRASGLGDASFGNDRGDPEHLTLVDSAGPKLSLIKNDAILELDMYRGLGDTPDQAVSLADDLVEALLAHSPSDVQDDQVASEDDAIAMKLAKVDWIASFNMFSNNGFPLTDKALQKSSFLGEEGFATVAVLEFSDGVGSLLDAGQFEYATVTERSNSKTILADIEGRCVSAKLKPGSPSKKLVSKILAGLTVVSKK
jgi:hypothetical protein